ncbi:MAG: 3-oxoacyl-[acyl-carrier-protein] reductase [Candidatus Tritonobacter lacicola]|nr:3-oxoacyl-[acyl-carrier-protein] reductase [Candidatus Tritonobacter lacicola]
MMFLEDKVAIVTGAGRGIGREIALTFAREGARVAVVDIREETASETAGEAAAAGADSIALGTDVSDAKSAQEAVDNVIDKFGRVDILVNNAGVTADGLIMKMSDDSWNRVLDINLKGAFNFIKAVVRKMMKQRSGRIINISSVVGIMGNAGQANYAASKAGLIGLTKSVAKELASRGVTVNAIAPGFIATQMTESLPDEVKNKMLGFIPVGSFGAPSDVANAALFLASDLSDYITGQVIVVDGGMVM